MFKFINRIIAPNITKTVSDRSIIAHEITKFRMSKKYQAMIDGVNYYDGIQDILNKQRTSIGENGKPIPIEGLANSKVTDNQYRKAVMQKVNYLVGKPFTVNTENETYQDILGEYFDRDFFKKLKNVTKDSLNCGIGWMCVLYNEQGEFEIRRIKPYEIIPGWLDVDHTKLEYVIRAYDVDYYDGKTDSKITKVEYYTVNGVDYYEYQGGSVVECPPYHQDYFTVDGKTAYNWDRLPFIAFKYNDEEKPLITCCKSLQDGLNTILSNFEDNMVEDMRNTILVLVNYDGTNLGEFRRNLATYGAVKVKSVEGITGDVKALQVTVNAENYKAIVEIFKKAIIENCMAFDAKDDKSGTPNQMNIQSMYSDIDLDASDMETEFQASMDNLLYFVDLDILYQRKGDYENEKVEITFSTDLPMDETTKINNLKNSVGLISDKTILANHPYVTDVQAELDQMEEEKQSNMEQYGMAFQPETGEEGVEDEEQ